VRGKDGSLMPASSDNTNSDSLKELWGKQTATLEITPPSIKDDLKIFVSTIKNKKTVKSNANKGLNNQKPVAKSSNNQQKTHTLSVTIPAVKLPKAINPKTLPKKYIIAGASAILVFGTIWLVWPSGDKPAQTNEQSQVAGQIAYKVMPDYAVMSPSGAGVESLGGYALISPAGEPKVYAYTDTINGIPIKVSQQELPDSIGNDAQKLRDLASRFNATEQLEVDERSAYVGTSVDGPQSVIFVRENILVLIASDAKVPNKDWVEYLGNLKF
jgi:hypothetical protein